MSKDKVTLIRVDIREQDGWFVATSEDVPGFILADPSRDELVNDLPEAMRVLYTARHGVECRVEELA